MALRENSTDVPSINLYGLIIGTKKTSWGFFGGARESHLLGWVSLNHISGPEGSFAVYLTQIPKLALTQTLPRRSRIPRTYRSLIKLRFMTPFKKRFLMPGSPINRIPFP